jgi:hypothetical protein
MAAGTIIINHNEYINFSATPGMRRSLPDKTFYAGDRMGPENVLTAYAVVVAGDNVRALVGCEYALVARIPAELHHAQIVASEREREIPDRFFQIKLELALGEIDLLKKPAP